MVSAGVAAPDSARGIGVVLAAGAVYIGGGWNAIGDCRPGGIGIRAEGGGADALPCTSTAHVHQVSPEMPVVQVTVTVPPPAEYAPEELAFELPADPRPLAPNSVTAGEVALTGGSPRPSNAATRDEAEVPDTVAVPAELCPWVATAVPNPVAPANDIEPPVTASQIDIVPPLAVTEIVMDPVGGFRRVKA
jgi:hypothetical protein